jgi:hypothetical protein
MSAALQLGLIVGADCICAVSVLLVDNVYKFVTAADSDCLQTLGAHYLLDTDRCCCLDVAPHKYRSDTLQYTALVSRVMRAGSISAALTSSSN